MPRSAWRHLLAVLVATLLGSCVVAIDDVQPAGSGGADAGTDADPCAICKSNEACCDGACVDTTETSAHCGGCNKPCPGTTCISSECTNDCKLGSADCDGNLVNGCEAQVATDPKNCGACQAECSAPSGGSATCAQGVCALECNPGRKLCDVTQPRPWSC